MAPAWVPWASWAGGGRQSQGAGVVASLREVERQAIVDALASTEGNRTRAAELLGISRRTLFNKLRELDEQRPGD